MSRLIAQRAAERVPLLQTTAENPVDTSIADLERSSRADLVEQWRTLYRRDPPKGIGRRLLTGAIAYEMQMRQSGQSGASLRRRLERYPATGPRTAASGGPHRLKPGARLVREWNGSAHVVDVGENGYLWNGTRYRSLSAVARAITGTAWSGPRFFGLNRDIAR